MNNTSDSTAGHLINLENERPKIAFTTKLPEFCACCHHNVARVGSELCSYCWTYNQELLETLKEAVEEVDGAQCESVHYTNVPWKHSDLCNKITKMLAEAGIE